MLPTIFIADVRKNFHRAGLVLQREIPFDDDLRSAPSVWLVGRADTRNLKLRGREFINRKDLLASHVRIDLLPRRFVRSSF